MRSPAARSRASPFSATLARRARTVRDLGERRLLDAIRPYLSPAGRGLLVGAHEDDDAALWRSEAGTVASTVDTMVEGIDFRRDWPGFTFRNLGRRLMAINLSDLAAMGAEPRHALISIAVPGATRVADVEALYRGIAERARQYDCTIAGGDLSGTVGPLVVTAALYGRIALGRQPLRRAGARAGWALAVTGRLGPAAAGLRLLLDGKRPRTAAQRRWVKALYDPQPRLEAAGILQAAGVRVAGDISDGLYREVERIARPAGLGAIIDADRLPLDPDLRRNHEQAWSGGLMESEDYELVCAAPKAVLEAVATRLQTRLTLKLSIIGSLTRRRGIRVRVDGRLVAIPRLGAGFDHFH